MAPGAHLPRAHTVLGVVLLAILQNYYLNQEISYLSGNAQAIAKMVSPMLSGNAPHDEIQSQMENLAFFFLKPVFRFMTPTDNCLTILGPLKIKVSTWIPSIKCLLCRRMVPLYAGF